jgi:hypothetical protein
MRGQILHSMLIVMHDGWQSNPEGSGSSAAFWTPAIKTDQGAGAEGNGTIQQGMFLQLNPAVWTDARIRQQLVPNQVSYTYEGVSKNSNSLYDRGPGSGNTVPWPIDGGPMVTHRELLHIIIKACVTHGVVPHDGGGTSIGFRMEHADSAKWETEVVQGGENPTGFGYGMIMRDNTVYPTLDTFYGFPWRDLRVINGSKTTAGKYS